MIKDIGDLYPNGEVDKEIIENFSKEFDVIFPPEYIDLISKHDGIYPEISSFDYVDTDGELNISSDDYDRKLIGFGATPGGNLICFDYRFPWVTNQPKIVLVLHDDFYDLGINEGKRKILYLANSFSNFINSLHEFIEY